MCIWGRNTFSRICARSAIKGPLLLSRASPKQANPTRTYHTHAKIIFHLFALSIFCFWIDFYRNVNFSALLETHLIAISGSK
jgi:hypothetical protein